MANIGAWLCIILFIGTFALTYWLGNKYLVPLVIKLKTRDIKKRMRADIEAEAAEQALWDETVEEYLADMAKQTAKDMNRY